MNPTARLALVAAQLLVAWLVITGLGGRGDPWPVAGAVTIALAAYLAGSILPRAVVPWAAVTVGATALLAVLLPAGPMSEPLSAPLGYANANAAWVVQGAASLAVAAWTGPAWLRLPAGVGIVGAALLCLEIGANAATAGAMLVLLALLTVDHTQGRRASIALSLAALLGGGLLAFLVGSGVASDQAERVLGERRVTLWTQGADALDDSPVLGVGAGNFHRQAAAAGDRDTRHAHAEPLQRTVESGIPGAVLELTAIFAIAWSLVERGSRAAVCALAGWGALWANAGIDWIVAFPAVLATAAFVAGMGTGRLAQERDTSITAGQLRPLAHEQ